MRAFALQPLHMVLFALGINHRSAPVHIREQVNFEPARLPDALRELRSLPEVDEGLIVSTCNRTELYCSGGEGGVNNVRAWLAQYQALDADAQRCLYSLDPATTVHHTFQVACGLDSMVIGEPQILGQLKDAYRAAHEAGTVGPILNRLFQQAFAVAKQVRTDTGIGASAVSIAYAAVTLARQIFAELSKHTALLIGAGDTIELVARHLHGQQLGRIVIANRRIENAYAIAAEIDGLSIGLEEINAHLADADIVVSATSSPDPVVTRAAVSDALKRRRRRPMFIVDLAVPRDVEPAVAELEDVYLYNVDDLQRVIENNLRLRHEAAVAAEAIVKAEALRFDRVLRMLDAVPVIRAVRDQAEAVKMQAIEQARRQLAAGRPPQEVLQFLAATLTNKLLHAPSAGLRRAGEEGDAELLEAARVLFGLKE
jgi:glutamyl-tRNA reductase